MDEQLALITPDLNDIPMDDKAEPRTAGVEHNVSEEEIEEQA